MLRHLRIRNLALIEEAALEIHPGMTVLTGETGAGKSLVLDALGLLAGDRTNPSLVRSGADRTTVEALFETSSTSLLEQLAKEGLEPEEGGELLLRREVLASGRSRASINGRLVPLSQLERIAASLLQMQGQHEQVSLLDPEKQRDLFDQFSGLMELRGQVARAHAELGGLLRDAEGRDANERQRAQRRDFLQFQIEELENLAVQPGELAELEAERRRLSHVEELRALGAAALGRLSEGLGETPAATELLGGALADVEHMAEHDPGLQGAIDALYEAQSRLADAVADLERHAATLEADPARLEAVEDRIDALRRALRKHGPTEEEALARLAEMITERDQIDRWEEDREQLLQRTDRARAELLRLATELSQRREKSRAAFLRPLVALLHDFAMPKARLDLLARPVANGLDVAPGRYCSTGGLDEVELQFCANEGEEMQPLRRVASGGEMSRLLLALRTLTAEKGEVPLLVFDEVDAGISGAAARRIAERLAALGERHQVLCVTHNPAIAAAARTHLLVRKASEGGRTRTMVCEVEGIPRQAELARLLDGGQGSLKGMELAAELLNAAG